MFGVGDNVLRKLSTCVTSKFHISIFKVFWGRIRPSLLGTSAVGMVRQCKYYHIG